MSLVRDAINTLADAVAILKRGPSLPSERATDRALQALDAQDAAPARPPEAALAKLRRDLVALSREGHGYAMVPNREMRHAPWLLWSPQEPLAALPGLLDDLSARARDRRSLLRTLIEAWIAGYSADAVMIREAAAAVRRLIADHAHPSFRAWAKVDGELRMFDVTEGPRTIARLILESSDPVETVLASIGLDDPLRAVSGYMRAVQGELIAQAWERGGSSAYQADRLFAFVAPGEKLRFPEPNETGALAKALLAPWLGRGRGAAEATRLSIQVFLLAHLGDPRIRPRLWQKAGEEANALVRAWLTKASLNAFFNLIRDHALDTHWTYREAFWDAYLKAGAIADAWLAFGPTIYAEARSIKELRGVFGKLHGTGVLAEHSVLLMRVGDVIFCEWSHNGSLRAWPTDWGAAPRLTRSAYDRRDLMAIGLPFPKNAKLKGGNAGGTGLAHHGSNYGHWQGSVAELIARRTGLRLTERDYMPR